MKRSIISIMLILGLAAGVFAQSLQNNDYYKKSLEFEKLAEKALDDGEYTKAQEYAMQSQEYAALSRQYIAEQQLLYRARSSLTAARSRMNLANQINLKGSNPALYEEASKYFADANTKFNNKDYENSITDARKVVELLQGIDPKFVPRTDDKTGSLAASYIVKLNIEKRDCLWRIAGFSYIYNDPTQWRKIYEANKDTFPQPDNPDLILPGMILKIPSLKGETRSGSR